MFLKQNVDEPGAKMDDYALLYLLKGICHRYLSEHEEAIECFKEVLYWLVAYLSRCIRILILNFQL